MRRFSSFSRGVFEDTSLLRKSRKWGRKPTRNLLLLGVILRIGGVIGGFKLWSDNGLAYGGSGNGSDFISPLSTGETFAGEGSGGRDENAGEGGNLRREGGTANGGTYDQPEGFGGTQGESSQGSQPIGEAREGNRGSLPEASQEEQSEKEKLKVYLQEKSSPLGDYVEVLYQEERNANLSGLSRLVVAIAGAESKFGKLCPVHNAWGIKCGSNTYCQYLSYEEGIKAITSLLRKPLYGFDGQVSEGDIWRIAKIYAESDRWPYSVSFFWNELEGR